MSKLSADLSFSGPVKNANGDWNLSDNIYTDFKGLSQLEKRGLVKEVHQGDLLGYSGRTGATTVDAKEYDGGPLPLSLKAEDQAAPSEELFQLHLETFFSRSKYQKENLPS